MMIPPPTNLAPRPPVARPARAARRAAGGFSLVELSVAIALSAVVMMALASAMVLASRALPEAKNPALASHEVGRVLEQLSTDLQHALYIRSRSAHAITFTVADRTGDGSPQRMRYAWSGEPGDPLTWQLDDHEPVTLLEQVDAFTLTYEQVAHTRTFPGPPVVGSEMPVSVHGLPASGNRSSFTITSSNWIGQYITADLPGNPDALLGWRPTYVSYRANRPLLFGSDHWVRLVVPELNRRPSGTVLAHRRQSGGLLSISGMSWVDAHFNDAPRLKAGEPVNLIVRHPGSGTTAAYIEHDTNGFPGGETRTTSGQSGWTSLHDHRALIHALYAVPYTAGPAQSLTRHHLTRVQLNVRASGEQHPPFDTAVHLANRPAVLRSFWEADFRHDPTALNVNAGDAGDWRVIDGQAFDVSNLDAAAGIWQARQALRIWPNHNFSEPAVVRAQMRHTSPDGGAAMIALHADRRGGQVGPVGVRVQRQSDDRQTVTLLTWNNAGQTVPLTTVPDRPPGFVDVRLIVMPASRSVHLAVDGVDRGTYQYNRVDSDDENRAFELTGWRSDQVQFKYVRVTGGAS